MSSAEHAAENTATEMNVSVTINGRRVMAPEGATILEAARSAGIRIPTLCHHPDLSNVGACRMCVVSVEKAKALQTACTTPVTQGMVIDTESEEARDTRRFVLSMLLTDHPNDCMMCEVNGDCELQDLVYEYQVPWPEEQGKHHAYPVDPDPNPFVLIDRNKCILCTRCVRACGERQSRDVWSIATRGFESRLVAGADQLLLEARCESCGQCVAYCPVGTLYDKMSAGAGRISQWTKVRTTCSYCGVGCNFDLCVRDDKVVRVMSAADAPVNGMATCVKGRYGYDYIHHPDRLTRPLVRAEWLDPKELSERIASGEWSRPDPAAFPAHERYERGLRAGAGRRAKRGPRPMASGEGSSAWVAVDWDTALDVVARKFTRVKAESGGDALAVLTSAKCTSEENYLVNKFARQVVGTNNLDHCARL
jgi:predicted molibdopterin-dependent oxidoreductase YjgC